MVLPKHEDILKTFKSKQSGSNFNSGASSVGFLSQLPTHDSILSTIKANPDRFASTTNIPKKTLADINVPKEEPKKKGFIAKRFEAIKNSFKDIVPGIAKLPARTGVEVLNLATSTVDFAADFLADKIERDIRNPIKIPNRTYDSKKYEDTADKWINFYENNIGKVTENMKVFTQSLREKKFIAPTEEWSNASLSEKFTADHLYETIFYVGPGVISSLGAFALNPGLGFAVSAGSVADDVKTAAMDSGLDKEKADKLGLATGLVVGWLDKLVPDEIFSAREKGQFTSSFVKRLVKTTLKETGTEVAQEDIQIGVESTFRDDLGWDEIKTRNAMSALGGFLGGSGAQTLVHFTGEIRNGNIAGLEEEDFKNISEVSSNAETLNEYISKYKEEATNYITASDFSDMVFAMPETTQLGFIDSKLVKARDSVDTETVESYKSKILNGDRIDPIIAQKNTKGAWVTTDGSNRITAFQELGLSAPIIYSGADKVAGFKTLSEVYETASAPTSTTTETAVKGSEMDSKEVSASELVIDTKKDYAFEIGGDSYTGASIEVGGKVIGGVAVDYEAEVPEISGIKIKPSFRKKGYGKLVAEKLLAERPEYYIRSVPESKKFWESVGVVFNSFNEDSGLHEGYLSKEAIDTTQADIKTQQVESQRKQDLGRQAHQLERRASEKLEDTSLKDVVGDAPLFKSSIEEDLNTVIDADKKSGKLAPSQDTKTIEKDWSGEFVLPDTSKWQRFRRLAEDMNIRLKVLNQAIENTTGSALPETKNLWALKDLLPRRQSDLIRRVNDLKKDFVYRLALDKVSVEELDEYRLALHAKERNAEMNARRKEIGQDPEDGLSGMTDKEADEILARDNTRMDKFIAELKRYDRETIDYQVANDLLDFEKAERILSTYKNYAPLFRDMSEDFTGIGTGQGISTPANLIKRAKGSKRRVVSPVANTFQMMERTYAVKLKNDIGKTIVDLTKTYPFLGEVFKVEKEPVGVLAKREFKAEIDQQFVDQLVTLAKDLGLEVFSKEGHPSTRLGYYNKGLNKAVRKFATSRETLAHEIGHFFDIKLGLADRVLRLGKFNKTADAIEKEIYIHSEKEVGEKADRLAMPEERFANAFSWWLVHRDLATQSMPEFNKAITEVVSKDKKLRELLNIKPTPKPQLESITEDIWGRVFRTGDNVILTKIKGKEYFITVNDPDVARSLKNINLARVPTFLKTFRGLLGIWSGFKTRYRPEFIITNFQRDLGEAMVNLNVESAMLQDKGKGLQLAVVKGIPSAQKEVWQYIRGKDSNETIDTFFKDGGDTGHFWMESVMDAEQSLYDLEKELNNQGIEKIKNPVKRSLEALDDFNTMVELGVRYSAYKELTSRGMSSLAAIQAVADLTVNFSRQGEMSPILKTFYGFINPAIQGSSKVIRTVASKKGRTRMAKAITGLVALGFISGSLSKLIDDEGDEKISEWNKNHKLVFALGNGKELNLWSMPYGYTTFYSMGRQMAELAWGDKTIEEAAKQVLGTGIDSFSPFGTSLNDFVPTLAKPIYDINSNNAWYDGKIHPDQVFTKTPKPNSAVYFNNTSKVAIFIAEMMNNLTGGSAEKSGALDMRPDDLEYLYDQWFGGPFEFVTSSIESAARTTQGDFDPNRTPFVRQFYREGSVQQWSYGVIYDTLEIAYKKDLDPIQKERFYKAVDTGLEEGIFDQERANGYIKDFVRAIYKIDGDLTEKENLKKLSEADKEDVDRLISAYAIKTQNSLKLKLKAFE